MGRKAGILTFVVPPCLSSCYILYGFADKLPEPTQNPAVAAQPPQIFWILLVGDSNTGKTSLVNRLLSDTFEVKHQPTEGAYSKQHPLQLGGQAARLQVWLKCLALSTESSLFQDSASVFPVLHVDDQLDRSR